MGRGFSAHEMVVAHLETPRRARVVWVAVLSVAHSVVKHDEITMVVWKWVSATSGPRSLV